MSNESLTDKIYRELRADLIENMLPVNSFLVEKTVCERYNCSKATAGEVLHQLCSKGFLVSFPRKGYMLSIPSSKDFFHIQRLRYAIESMEIQWIIRHCSEEKIKDAFFSEEMPLDQMNNETFHLRLAELLEDQRLYGIMENLLGIVVYTFRATPFFKSEQDIPNVHGELIDAILLRDEDAALEVLRKDLQYDDAIA